MKKFVIIIGLLILIIITSVFMTLNKGETNSDVDFNWHLESRNINNIELYGSQQPLKVHISYSDKDYTEVRLYGKMSLESKDILKRGLNKKDNEIYLPLSKHGFKLMLNASGKSELKLDISLGRDVVFKKISIDTLVGDVTVVVPKTFEGLYNIHNNHEAKIIHVPKTQKTQNSVIEIDGYNEIRVDKE